jgi:putative spermidine/putrescine transport system permease protein
MSVRGASNSLLPQAYWWFVLPALLLVGSFYLLPLAGVLSLSVLLPKPGLQNYSSLIELSSLRRVFWTTFRICTIATLLSVMGGYVVAYGLTVAGRTSQRFLLLLVMLPFWISALIRAFSWLLLLGSNGVINRALQGAGIIDMPLPLVRNELGVVIGMVHYLIPYAILPLYAVMRGIDRRHILAAQSLGARPLRCFLQIFLPQSMPGLFSAVILVFIFAMGFFITPAILGGGKLLMVAEYISISVLQTVRWGLAAALSVVLLSFTLLLIAVLARVMDVQKALGAHP